MELGIGTGASTLRFFGYGRLPAIMDEKVDTWRQFFSQDGWHATAQGPLGVHREVPHGAS
jgi:hypothetical protein